MFESHYIPCCQHKIHQAVGCGNNLFVEQEQEEIMMLSAMATTKGQMWRADQNISLGTLTGISKFLILIKFIM